VITIAVAEWGIAIAVGTGAAELGTVIAVATGGPEPVLVIAAAIVALLQERRIAAPQGAEEIEWEIAVFQAPAPKPAAVAHLAEAVAVQLVPAVRADPPASAEGAAGAPEGDVRAAAGDADSNQKRDAKHRNGTRSK
jgi:hypothetical protein